MAPCDTGDVFKAIVDLRAVRECSMFNAELPLFIYRSPVNAYRDSLFQASPEKRTCLSTKRNNLQEKYELVREAERHVGMFAAYMQHIEFKKFLKLTIHF